MYNTVYSEPTSAEVRAINVKMQLEFLAVGIPRANKHKKSEITDLTWDIIKESALELEDCDGSTLQQGKDRAARSSAKNIAMLQVKLQKKQVL